jgi:Lectin C-type domain
MKNQLLKFSTILVGMLLTPLAYADTDKIFWQSNGHYYQLIVDDYINWRDAKTACGAKGAHLATITSRSEQLFINQNLIDGNFGFYFIGGSDAARQKNWRWVTGEPWSYSNWSLDGSDGRQPSNNLDEDYLVLGPHTPDDPESGFSWFDVDSTTPESGYICEWTSDVRVAASIVPDINKNGKPEIAVLIFKPLTKTHLVQIKDTHTKQLLNTINFITANDLPLSMVALRDISGNKIPDIAVLLNWQYVPTVVIKDAKVNSNPSPVVKRLTFFDENYKALAMTVSADSNNNGTDEITVLAQHLDTLAVTAETRDSKTGAILAKIDL